MTQYLEYITGKRNQYNEIYQLEINLNVKRMNVYPREENPIFEITLSEQYIMIKTRP